MPVDPLVDPGSALRAAAAAPRAPVDPARVLERARALRRRRAALSAATVVALLVPVAAVTLLRPAGLLRFGDGSHDSVDATRTDSQAPPRTLADGSPLAEVPEAVASVFPGPVVGARREPALLSDPPEACRQTPLGRRGEPVAAAVGARLDAIARAADPVAAHVGPAFAATLAVTDATSPPPYTGAVAAVCVAQHDGGRWQSPGLGVDHLYERWTGAAQPDGGGLPGLLWVTAFEVPAGAAWAVQEHRGWWLAYAVDGDAWLLAQTPGDPPAGTFPGARVVFVDPLGRVLADRRTDGGAIPRDAPLFTPQRAGAPITVGRASQVRARLGAGGDPLPVCAADRGVCVWLVDLDGDLVALSAAGPHPLDVMPLGTVGYCPAGGTFQGTSTGSVFDRRGRLLDGASPSGLHRYDVVEEGGQVLVDLDSFVFGPDVEERLADPGAARCPDPVEPQG